MGSQRYQLNDLSNILQLGVLDQDPVLRAKHIQGNASFIDTCSGSGAVSIHLRQAGWLVQSIDSEPYAWYWNYYAMHCTNESLEEEIKRYRELQGIPMEVCVVDWWNNVLKQSNGAKPHFEKHYAPNDSCTRMYYQPHVARWIDNALHMHTTYSWEDTPLLHAFFVSEVLQAMIKAANTSGTMKSFYSQWGGPTGHRLNDITQCPSIRPIWSIAGPVGEALVQDATTFKAPDQTDVIYFNPPSSVHQYASCYHLLNVFVNGDYKEPKSSELHGGKSGISSDAYSSPFSKYTTVTQAWNQWIEQAQMQASWLIVTYEKKGLLSSEEIVHILQQHGRNTVERHLSDNSYVYTVKTNSWQSPNQLKRMLAKTESLPVVKEYYQPLRLCPRFTLKLQASKIRVYDQGLCIASINRRYKITWFQTPSESDSALWNYAAFTANERFQQYLIEKQWLSACTCLKAMQSTCSIQQYLEQWTMLDHLARVYGEHDIVKKVKKLKP